MSPHAKASGTVQDLPVLPGSPGLQRCVHLPLPLGSTINPPVYCADRIRLVEHMTDRAYADVCKAWERT